MRSYGRRLSGHACFEQIPLAVSHQAEQGTERSEEDPKHNGTVPSAVSRNSGDGIGGERTADIGDGIENADNAADAPDLLKGTGDPRDEDMIDGVHASGDPCHEKDDHKKCERRDMIQKKDDGESRGGAEGKQQGRGDTVRRVGHADLFGHEHTYNAKDGENGGGQNGNVRAEPADLYNKIGHPRGNAVAE